MQATAASEDGTVPVVAADRQASGVEMDARLLRPDPADVAGRLRAVVNTALDRTRPAAAPAPDVPPVDLAALGRWLDAVPGEGMAETRHITGTLGEVVAQINRCAVMSGAYTPPDLDGLLARTRTALAAAQDSKRPEAGEGAGRARLRGGVGHRCGAAPALELTCDIEAAPDEGLRELRGHVTSLRALMGNVEPKESRPIPRETPHGTRTQGRPPADAAGRPGHRHGRADPPLAHRRLLPGRP
ncbi:hypothetical protein [Actinomadura parmotrematis]|uniref:DUF222 domain-containing protein n=1 Tax=Actinomadura parmotrematis TaxID=2864039 RepID=A0ABS7FYN7_9ACTN|nr:hypothetical protein [Actinomadura parmotrematis]MBW8485556.1 hypothetical protein [Actinomadura parmotrematis]